MIEEIKWMQKHIFGKEWNPDNQCHEITMADRMNQRNK
jgi:hypothetical protein